jgi:hypothetical protein
MMKTARFFDFLLEDLNVAGMTAGCPGRPIPKSKGVKHSFSSEELALFAKEEGIGLIVHRGRQVQIPGFCLIHSHTEISVVFAGGTESQKQVSLDQIIDYLTVSGSRSRRNGDGPILRHGGTLNMKSLQFVLSQLGAGNISNEKKHCFHSYRELAVAGIRMPGALVIGLRGKEASRPQLHPVLVNGLDPLDPITRVRYPLQYRIHVYLKDNQSDISRNYALRYFDTIRKRIAVDALSLFNAGSHFCPRSVLLLAA